MRAFGIRRMKRLAFIGAVMVGFPFVPSSLCGAEESPDHRVSWDVEGYLSGLVDVQPHKVSDFAALRRARWSHAQTVVLKKGKTKKNKELTSCEDLLSVYDAIVDSAPPMRWTDLQLTKVQCGVMDRISRLASSRTGYLRQRRRATVGLGQAEPEQAATQGKPAPELGRRRAERGVQ